jgi:UDP-GlcNAc:undecaprenyl-phosphate GlcNAc-1-phosphate transferase
MNLLAFTPLAAGIAAVLLGVVGTASLTPGARRLALRFRILDLPNHRKLQRVPVPYLGGVAVVGALLVGWAVLRSGWIPYLPVLDGPVATALLAGALAMMLLGLADDIWGLSPRFRLIGQVLIILAVLAPTGVFETMRLGSLTLALPPVLTVALATFWVLAMTNAGNLMDGMDGLAAGVGATASAGLAYLALAVYGQQEVGALLALIAGAYAGFLIFNSHPARIYLGDAGSLPLGFALGAGALFATSEGGTWHAVPAMLVLGVPATDLLLAVLRRGLSSLRVERAPGATERFVFRLAHRPRFFEGDQEHLHHRLLERLGSVTAAVRALYVVAIVLALLGVWAAWEPRLAPMLLVGSMLLGLMAVSRFLHPELRVFEKGVLLPLFHTRALGNRRHHFIYDMFVFAGAFVVAGWLGTRWWPGSWVDLVRVASAGMVGAGVMGLLGLYRIHFRRAGVWSVWKATSTVGAGAAAVLLLDTLALQMPLSSASGLLFAYLALTGTVLPRAAYGFVDEAYSRRPHGTRATLIYGTGRAELAFLQRALCSEALDLRPVGLLDDSPELDGKMIQGFPVYRANGGEVDGLLRSLEVKVVVIVGEAVHDTRELRLHLAAQAAGASLLRYRESLAKAVPPRGSRLPGAQPALEELRVERRSS